MLSHPFNDPDGVADFLQRFKSTNWAGKSFDDLVREYRIHLFTVPTYPITIKKGTILYRARKNEGREEKLFGHVNEIGLKDSSLVKSFGRASVPGVSVFYASTNEQTVVREVTQWYVNDTGRFQDVITKGLLNADWNPFTCMMTISAWRVQEDLQLALLFGSEQSRSKIIEECAHDRLQNGLGETEEYRRSKNLVIDFFSQEFGKIDVKSEWEYLYSAYYAFEVFANTQTEYPSIKFDGVQYASIANECRGENIAISASAYRHKMRFLGANFCYTYNNRVGKIENEESALIGRVYAAIQLPDNSFDWVISEDDFNFIDFDGVRHTKLLLPPTGSRFPLAVKRISAGIGTDEARAS